jgi:hypothetical protein
MADSKAVVRIQRGRYSSHFQVARAWLSAASALVNLDPESAISFIDGAIHELKRLRKSLVELV